MCQTTHPVEQGIITAIITQIANVQVVPKSHIKWMQMPQLKFSDNV